MIRFRVQKIQCFILHAILLPFAHSSQVFNRFEAAHCPTFTPCPPPKFDLFLDSILGPWTATKETVATVNPPRTSSAEEVMRSCGGAIQGMKEIEYPNSPFDRMYNNRADDGFLFFDCGSYVNGPISVAATSKEDDIDFSLVSSLSFNSISPKRRIIISTASPKMALLLTKGSSIISSSADEKIMLLDECPLDNIKWDEVMLCKMSSSSQPWMLQRAKWEKYKAKMNADENVTINNEDSSTTSESYPLNPKCWIESCNLKLNDESNEHVRVRMLSDSEAFRSLSTISDVTHIIQIGAMVQNDVKAFLRCYNDEGTLRGVMFQTGKLFL